LCKQNVEGEKFQDHLIEHAFDNEAISCVVCHAIFSTINSLKDHLREHKLTQVDFKEACTMCNAKFLYNSELKHHLKEHEIMESQTKTIKQEENDVAIDENDDEAVIEKNVVVKEIKDEEDDDYIEIENVPDN
jgi:hypothetical protein